MINIRIVCLSALLPLALASCGGSKKDEAAALYCPPPLTVTDASTLTRFKPGPGRDPRDVMFEASLTGAGTACSLSRGRMDIDLKMRIAVNAGPSVAAGTSSVPYFVRIIDANGSVKEGRDFNADYKLSTANPRGSSLEELTLSLPFDKPTELGGYRIAVGLKPTPEELQYNRRAK
jgi:hypothetical protein